jgi:predicted dehydrogenase
MIMKKIAVVGFGFMGSTHTINILKNPELELVAFVDKNPGNIMKNLTEQVVSKNKIYTDLEDCLAV